MRDKNKKKVQAFVDETFFWETSPSGKAVLKMFVEDTPRAISDMGAARFLQQHVNKELDDTLDAEDIAKFLGPITLQHVYGTKNAPTEKRLFNRGPYLFVNDWRPHKIHDVEPSDTAPEIWTQFMEMLFPVKAERDHIETWLAVMAMRPSWHLRHGIILRSIEMGVGKDVLLETIIGECVLGRNNFAGVSLTGVTGRFNALMAGKRLVHVRELYRGNSDSADALKQWVTSETIRIEEKYEQAYVSDFFGCFAISSNDERPIELEPDDRRWFVPTLLERHYKDKKEHDAFFTRLIDTFQHGDAAEKLAAYFEGICVKFTREGFDAFSNRPPMTKGKEDLIKYDLKTEQVEALKRWLEDRKGQFVFTMPNLVGELAKQRSNILKQNDVAAILKELGYEYSAQKTRDSLNTAIRVWMHPEYRIATGRSPKARIVWVSDSDQAFKDPVFA